MLQESQKKKNVKRNISFGIKKATGYRLPATGQRNNKPEQKCTGYDPVNNWYIKVNGDHEVLSSNITTGETIKTFKPEFTINEIKLWRE
jgi:hypothetical protein